MKIGFIGAGKVGFTLGRFFAQGGLRLTGYYSRQPEAAREAARFTRSAFYSSMGQLAQDSDAIFLTVPDGSISSIYEELRQWGISHKQICHCSGAMTAGEAFPGIDAAGAYGYSIHPLFPVSSKYEAYRELPGAFFCLEGEGPHLSRWAGLLRDLGARAQFIPGEGKARYHAACVIASNLVCALAQESVELLEGCGFSGDMALQALAPLMRSNLEHLLQKGPVGALTGPVERRDLSTVEKHLNCLPAGLDRELYRTASQKLLCVARAKHPDADYQSIEHLLKKEYR